MSTKPSGARAPHHRAVEICVATALELDGCESTLSTDPCATTNYAAMSSQGEIFAAKLLPPASSLMHLMIGLLSASGRLLGVQSLESGQIAE